MPTLRSAGAPRLDKSVLWGFAAGLLYTLADGYLDHTFGAQVSPPVRPIEVLHALIDFVLPSITGALLGMAVHYVRLRASMAELEKQRADDLTRDLQKIERDQAVWVISASLLHELKNPLHALGLLLDDALDVGASEPDQQRQILLRARAQVERIAAELATLRALPTTARPELPDVDVEALVRAAVAVVVQKAPNLELSIQVAPGLDARVRANPAYVRIIVENLLENAVDALADDAEVGEQAIEVRITQSDARCFVEVSDNGPGIDADAREHLFEPLNTTKPAGMGLGLSIARTLARAMGGDLLLHEQPVGARFRLSLVRGGQYS